MQHDQRLAPHHVRMLREGSAISPEVIAARGYRTIFTPSELEAYGFSQSQRRAPGLLLPVHPTDGGKLTLYVYRPDKPRVRTDRAGTTKALKYEIAAGASMRLDCPPLCQPTLGDPSVPLWITEGQKKADALASQGACAIAVLGVWNWRGKNSMGGTTLLADWDHVALNGRDVRLVFDSDVMTKTQVRQALDRLTEHLQRKGAHVTAVYLPNGPEGTKVGVDDYLAQGRAMGDLESLVETPRPSPQPAAPQVELLEDAAPTMRRPLELIAEHAYAATWLPCRVTVTERQTRSGEIVVVNPPEVTFESKLFILRADGLLFGEGVHRPLDDLGFQVELPTLPRNAATMSKRAIQAYTKGVRPDAASVVERISSIYDRYIDFGHSLGSQLEMCRFAACLSLATWFMPAWTVIGYPWFYGEKGSGKTQAGTVWAQTSFLGTVVLSSGTFAALRDLAEAGASLVYDDAEVLADGLRCDPAKRELALSGNRRGTLVPLKEPLADRGWTIRWVDAFAPRAFTSITPPEDVLASRCIIIPLVRTGDWRRANADPANLGRWPCDRQQLLDDCWALALSLVHEAQEVWAELDEEVDTIGRDFEPWRAPIATARLLDRHGANGLERTVRDIMQRYREERVDLMGEDRTVALVRVLAAYLEDAVASDTSDVSDGSDMSGQTRQQPSFILSASEIASLVRHDLGSNDGDRDWATPERMGKMLSRLRLKRVRESSRMRSRGWVVDLDVVQRLAYAYGIPTSLVQATPANPDRPLSPEMSEPSEPSNVSDVGLESDRNMDEVSTGSTLPVGRGPHPQNDRAVGESSQSSIGPCGRRSSTVDDLITDEERTILEALGDLGTAGYSSVALHLGRAQGPTRRALEALRQHGYLLNDAHGLYRLAKRPRGD